MLYLIISDSSAEKVATEIRSSDGGGGRDAVAVQIEVGRSRRSGADGDHGNIDLGRQACHLGEQHVRHAQHSTHTAQHSLTLSRALSRKPSLTSHTATAPHDTTPNHATL